MAAPAATAPATVALAFIDDTHSASSFVTDPLPVSTSWLDVAKRIVTLRPSAAQLVWRAILKDEPLPKEPKPEEDEEEELTTLVVGGFDLPLSATIGEKADLLKRNAKGAIEIHLLPVGLLGRPVVEYEKLFYALAAARAKLQWPPWKERDDVCPLNMQVLGSYDEQRAGGEMEEYDKAQDNSKLNHLVGLRLVTKNELTGKYQVVVRFFNLFQLQAYMTARLKPPLLNAIDPDMADVYNVDAYRWDRPILQDPSGYFGRLEYDSLDTFVFGVLGENPQRKLPIIDLRPCIVREPRTHAHQRLEARPSYPGYKSTEISNEYDLAFRKEEKRIEELQALVKMDPTQLHEVWKAVDDYIVYLRNERDAAAKKAKDKSVKAEKPAAAATADDWGDADWEDQDGEIWQDNVEDELSSVITEQEEDVWSTTDYSFAAVQTFFNELSTRYQLDDATKAQFKQFAQTHYDDIFGHDRDPLESVKRAYRENPRASHFLTWFVGLPIELRKNIQVRKTLDALSRLWRETQVEGENLHADWEAEWLAGSQNPFTPLRMAWTQRVEEYLRAKRPQTGYKSETEAIHTANQVERRMQARHEGVQELLGPTLLSTPHKLTLAGRYHRRPHLRP